MSRRRRSLLQNQILLALRERPATTVTELAGRLGAKRPSVSRSLSLLIEAALVGHPTQTKWELTEVGRAEAEIAEERLAAEVIRSIKAASRRVVTLRDKDGNMQRFVAHDYPDEVAFDNRARMRCAGVPDTALAAVKEAAGLSIRIGDLDTLYGKAQADIVGTLRKLGFGDQHPLSPFASIADEHFERLRNLMSGESILDSAQAALGAAGALADPFINVKDMTIGALAASFGDLSAYESSLSGLAMSAASNWPLDVATDMSGFSRMSEALLGTTGASAMASACSAGITSLLDRTLAFDVSSVLGPIAATQDLYAGSLAAMASAWAGGDDMAATFRLATLPTALLDGIAGDVMAIQRAELDAVRRNHSALLNLDWIGAPLEETTAAFQGAFADRLEAMSFHDYNNLAYGTDRYRELLATTTPVAYLTRGLRHYVEAEFDEEWVATPSEVAEVEMGYTTLDPILARIHPDLPDMRRSVWQTLARAEIEDRLSQAAVSMRRVIALIMDELVPVPEGTKMGMRDRLNLLMPQNKEDAKMAAAVLDAFGMFGGRINMVIHIPEVYRHEGSFRELLHSAEHMLAFIFHFGGVDGHLDT